MHIILGGTGHIGSALADSLLDRGEAVTVVCRTASKATHLKKRGAQIEVADINDVAQLRRIIERGKRLFLLNPPADPSQDFDAQERRTLAAIFAALNGARLEKIVAASTYGAQPGDHIGDLGSLYEMEQRLSELSTPETIIRGAFYMSNWDAQLPSARDQGRIYTFFPPDMTLPMVDPADIGRIAADLMTAPATTIKRYYAEGPERYSANDVAAAFSKALRRPVEPVHIPQAQWSEALRNMGFSHTSATSFANMFASVLSDPFPDYSLPQRGQTSINDYVARRVARTVN